MKSGGSQGDVRWVVQSRSLLKNSVLAGRRQMILGDQLTSRAVSIDNVRAIP
jgi:hypothetical protein